MIIVLGTVVVDPDRVAEALAESAAHVARSRGEPGCLAHAVHQEPTDGSRLVFVERWESAEALSAHFAVPESRAFGRFLAGVASVPPTIELFDATPLPLPLPLSRRG